MADWRNLVTKLILQDGVIDENEVKVLRKELYADGKIDKKEVDFLIELRNTAKESSPAFTKFFFKAIEDNVLKDGKIDAAEAKWLRKMLYADGKIDEEEKKFLQALKRKASEVSSAFTTLFDEAVGAPKPAEKAPAKPAKVEKPAPKVEKATAATKTEKPAAKKAKPKPVAKKPKVDKPTDNGTTQSPPEAKTEPSPSSPTPGT